MENWINKINTTTTEFKEYFSLLSSDELNWKPNAETWSIAQNIDHLMVINKSYFGLLKEVKSGQYRPPLMAKLGFIVDFLGKMILNAVKPDRKKKMKTFPIWEPSESDISSDILERFEQHQEVLMEVIKDAEGLISRGTIISSPANRNIVYTLEIAFDIIVSHEQRHLAQSIEVLVLLKQKAIDPCTPMAH